MLATIDGVLDWPALKQLRAALADGAFVDGQTTAGFRAKRVKHNEQLSPKAADRKSLDDMILNALRGHDDFQRLAFPKAIQRPLFSRYGVGMNYGLHVDDALMGKERRIRSDLSVTVFLNNPDDYDGGELEMMSAFGPQEVKLPAGSAVLYPSSTLHRVKPVAAGERLAAVTWVQSFIADPARREILIDVDRMRRRLTSVDPDGEETDLAFKTYANLLRMWSDV
ncbi:Fe2+-dependent dioxygenase [Pelagibius litoralis]|uniref:Fe2+-dependent dioxygenase n=1 Tax=Pelagibius litoralis TaxID=374515 RepID=A0A967C1R5_9PROT|nr:Fe2+-dependent dioxygenase [Pelagibius litoralis]NIA67726.1 Fe2+-dependent dioxygenase [Pelagibius litoralis]